MKIWKRFLKSQLEATTDNSIEKNCVFVENSSMKQQKPIFSVHTKTSLSDFQYFESFLKILN